MPLIFSFPIFFRRRVAKELVLLTFLLDQFCLVLQLYVHSIFIVWFSVNNVVNLRLSVVIFRSIMLSGMFTWLIFVVILSDSSVVPCYLIQSCPSVW